MSKLTLKDGDSRKKYSVLEESMERAMFDYNEHFINPSHFTVNEIVTGTVVTMIERKEKKEFIEYF
jgi:hypothetical protein